MNRHADVQIKLAVTVLLMGAGVLRSAEHSSTNAPVSPPPLPSIRALKLEPDLLTLKDGRDERRVLVWGKTDSDKWIDLTSGAVFKPDSGEVEIDAQGYIRPKAKGEGQVLVTAAGQTARLPVTVEYAGMPPVRFVRDIEPLISKAGCNAGTCHGSAKGKNG